MVESQEFYETLLSKLDKLNLDLLAVRRANSKLKGENRHLRRVIKSYKEEAALQRKPHYKNGRRGTKFNG